MHYIYIIKSINFPEKIYTGFTKDISKRIVKHNKGDSPHTKKYKPWELIYFCAFTNKKKALEFEKYLKSSSGIAFRNKRLI